MRLTPLDIKKQEFRRTLRGFDPLEVETFLEMAANEYESLLKEIEQLRSENQTLSTQLEDYQKVEQTLKETLMNAQESVSRARDNTEKEARLIVHEAELRAEKIIDGARREVDRLKNELVVLRSQKHSLASRLRHLLDAQIELINVLDKDDPDLNTGYEGTASPRVEASVDSAAAPDFAPDAGLESVAETAGETALEAEPETSLEAEYEPDIQEPIRVIQEELPLPADPAEDMSQPMEEIPESEEPIRRPKQKTEHPASDISRHARDLAEPAKKLADPPDDEDQMIF